MDKLFQYCLPHHPNGEFYNFDRNANLKRQSSKRVDLTNSTMQMRWLDSLEHPNSGNFINTLVVPLPERAKVSSAL